MATQGPLTFVVTREDMLRSKTLDPGWYKAKVKRLWQEPSNAGDSTNTWLEMIVIAGPEQKDKSNVADTPVRRVFSEKAPGMIVPFLKACGAQVGENGGNFDLNKCVGRELLFYNETRMWEGKPQNSAVDFKSV